MSKRRQARSGASPRTRVPQRSRWVLVGTVLLSALSAIGYAGDAPVPTPSEDELARAIVEGNAEDLRRAAGWMESMGRAEIEGVLKKVKRSLLLRAATESPLNATERAVTGSLLDASGRPVSGEVQLFRTTTEVAELVRAVMTREGSRKSVPLDASGRFQIEKVREGKYSLIAKVGGTEHGFKGIVVGGEDVQLTLTLGESALSAQVLDASDRPVPGAQVFLSPRGLEERTASGNTDDSGHVVISNLVPGAWRCSVAKGYLCSDAEVVVTVGKQEVAKATLRVGRHGLLVVTVADVKGQVAPGVFVSAQSHERGELISETTSDTGEARMLLGVGRWVLSAPGSAPLEPVVVTEATETKATLRLGK